MKSKAPAFQFYASDFLSDLNVATMTMSQRGVYITLIAHEWLEGKLPSDISTLKRLCGNPENWDDDWDKVSICFVERDGYIYNSRLEIERDKMTAYRERMSKAGKKGAEKRWENSPAMAKPSNKKKKKEVKVERELRKQIEKEFEEEFWVNYPRKHGRLKAKESYLKARDTFHQENIMLGLKMYVKYWSNTDKEIEYIPMASTWLNQCRFVDVSVNDEVVVKPQRPKSHDYICDSCEQKTTMTFEQNKADSICKRCGDGVLLSGRMFEHEKAIRKQNQGKISTAAGASQLQPRRSSTVGAKKLAQPGNDADAKTKFEQDFTGLLDKIGT